MTTGNQHPPTAAITLSGVNDEASPTWDLDESLAAFDALGWRHVALRAVGEQTVDEMDDATYDRVVGRLRDRGFGITSYLSMTLGRSPLDADDMADERRRMAHAIGRAAHARTRLIRAMGYRRGNCPGPQRLGRTIERLRELTRMAADADVVLGVEMLWPAWESVGGSPYLLREAMAAVDSPHLRVILDPGNTASFGDDPVQAVDLLLPFVADVHVKDCTAFSKRDFCLAGDGVSDWPYILRRLAVARYTGPITIEPHLQHGQQFHVTGHDGFVAAGRRIQQLLTAAGFELTAHKATDS